MTVDVNCVECEDGDICSTCKNGFIHEYNYETNNSNTQCIPVFNNCKVKVEDQEK